MNILVVGSEVHSGGLDKSPRGRGVSVIFGDGAGAVVVQENKTSFISLFSNRYVLLGKAFMIE